MRILGISALYHDSAAAMIEDGAIEAAAQEERFSRNKHDSGYPTNAIQYCLDATGCAPADLDYVAFYEKPFLKFERLVETYAAFAPRGFASFRRAIPIWLKEKLFQKDLLSKELKKLDPLVDWPSRLLFAEHHQSHAASAFYPSPFDEAVILTLDGVGEWATTSVAVGQGNKLHFEKEIHFPHSLGLLYTAFTYYLGFKVNSGEYKVMGLAPYGEPRYKDLILEHLIDLKDDGSFRLNQAYFDYCTGLRMTNDRFSSLMGYPPRRPEQEPLRQFHMDVAASIQAVIEVAMLRLTRALAHEYRIPNLCLAGGVALNCVANGAVLRDGAFERIWIQPAAGDAGGAIGAALTAWHQHLGQPRKADGIDAMRGTYLGPSYSQQTIETRLRDKGAKFEVVDEDALLDAVTKALEAEQAVGWFQGRMEFGPRALGARSILGDARSPIMQRTMNLKVKYRESFRPFAPSVLREDLPQWFDMEVDSPYMLLVAAVSEKRRRPMTDIEQALFGIDKLNVVRSEIPAVTHVDYSARIQTVHQDSNPLYHKLISRFKQRTGCPVILNTSFNIRGEPIVCTPEDAFRCFMETDIDVLAIGRCLLYKEHQDPKLARVYKEEHVLD